jgi:hypothetical protein
MRTLTTAFALGTFLAVPALVQSADAQRMDSAREQAVRECMNTQREDPRDGDEGKKTGGLQWQYKACMMDRGQIP